MVFKKRPNEASFSEVPLQIPCTGRGEINPHVVFDDRARLLALWHWRAWEGNTDYGDIIPGFEPFVLSASGVSRPPIEMGVDSPLWALYKGTYTAKDFDTDAEDALRVGKQLAALNVIVDALVHQGIIVKV